jgi:hypothetical protein
VVSEPREIPIEAAIPADIREEQIREIKRRLEEGELDTDEAVLETAFAMLDGDSAS